jgi:MoxR-like ATPase
MLRTPSSTLPSRSLALVPDLDRAVVAALLLPDADAFRVVTVGAERRGAGGADPLVAALVLLLELDRMEFFVYETGETIRAKVRPIVMITSNNEKELPDAFLRRCFFHYIKFPDRETMNRIIGVHFPDIKQRLVQEALRIFFEVREVPGLKKKPSTSELLDWLKLLLNEDITPEMLRERDPRKLIPPLHGALLKNEQDVHLFERLAFLSRREV